VKKRGKARANNCETCARNTNNATNSATTAAQRRDGLKRTKTRAYNANTGCVAPGRREKYENEALKDEYGPSSP
jgi:transposase-like protein